MVNFLTTDLACKNGCIINVTSVILSAKFTCVGHQVLDSIDGVTHESILCVVIQGSHVWSLEKSESVLKNA